MIERLGMGDEKNGAAARLRAARKKAGLSQIELAKRLGLPQSVVSDWERGVLISWRDHMDGLTRALGVTPAYFAASPSPMNRVLAVREIEVVGEVQGGAFRLAVEIPAEERTTVPMAAAALPGYDRVQLSALKVVGPSVNEVFPDGTFVIVASAADTDVRPGDMVVVYNRKSGLTESTIKEVGVEADGRIVLRPRSTHPDHQQPIHLADDDQDGPHIAFVVVGSYRPVERPAAPIQWRPKN